MTEIPGPPGWTVDEELAAYDQALKDRLNFTQADIDDTDSDWGPLITLAQVATLGGLARNTPGAARQRTLAGKARVPFPDADEDWLKRMPDKPLFPAYKVLDYFIETGNWPLGQAARLAQRHTRPGPKAPAAGNAERYNLTQLTKVEPRLAAKVRNRRLNDGARRSVKQWRHRVNNADPKADA